MNGARRQSLAAGQPECTSICAFSLIGRANCANNCTLASQGILVPETNTTKIKARLEREGWQLVGGSKHDKYKKAGMPTIMVPRHKTVTPLVARSIAKAAGWE
ncbi:MAG: addiction module toxin, HicA family [Mesorhizobium sp.]|nr:type II toxin-antitoxin system HicA family toxin [Mesorhizobium sp. M2A.F.Ca.ET.043.02.1.1]RUW40670.1 type II toxin-antitoxin system HicA family toxin [Mesorhizobium sp. M2A.F.Ca.ET.015.02.1.1]RUW76776.1 type II toxin-antitoxin system HicA family toxin [Mesorhizobium sp. M2A.F.Ca.ET.067.02.1.1]RVC93152.1 type II toxin-antitoxin system HicA family toxin [Mesorhizobium sp. M2A.F.Ca.ET.017.03.2.1]RVC93426.1 type II toxin-antitoxin system HicA family toxin [Mesorhizobium sp. M2A.F.Ca.ET.029.05.1